jgi:hypothetical protein
MKHTKQYLFMKEPVKTEDAGLKDDQRQSMKKPTKAKSVTGVLRKQCR